MGVFDDAVARLFPNKSNVEMKSYELKEGGSIETDSSEDLKEGQKVSFNGEVASGSFELKDGKKVNLSNEGVIESVEDPIDQITSMKEEIKEKDNNILKLSALVDSQKEENEKFKIALVSDAEALFETLKEDYESKLLEMSQVVEKIKGNAEMIKQDVNIEQELENPRETEIKAMSISEAQKLRNKNKLK